MQLKQANRCPNSSWFKLKLIHVQACLYRVVPEANCTASTKNFYMHACQAGSYVYSPL